MAYGDHDPFVPWVDWLGDYAALVAKGGKPVPVQLKDVDATTYHLIQACQMDSQSRGWEKVEGATDGWGLRIKTPAWLNVHYFSAGEEFTPGKKYEVYVRVKLIKKLKASGKAFSIGEFKSKINPSAEHPQWDVSLFTEDSFRVVKLGELTDPTAFYFCNNPGVVEELILDCFWLREIP